MLIWGNGMDALKKVILENKRFFGLILGLILGILIVTINFWRTLLIALCAWLGWYLTGTEGLKERALRLAEKIFIRK